MEKYIEFYKVITAQTLEELADILNEYISAGYNVEIEIDVPLSGQCLIKIGRFENK